MLIEFDDELAWAVFGSVLDSFVDGGDNATESGVGEIGRGGEVIPQSRRAYQYVIYGPLGMCAEVLFHAVPGDGPEQNSLFPDYMKNRIERLFASPGEGPDHAVSITFSKLNWLMYIDPEWVEHRLVPVLAFDHPAAEPAWNGFLCSSRFAINRNSLHGCEVKTQSSKTVVCVQKPGRNHTVNSPSQRASTKQV